MEVHDAATGDLDVATLYRILQLRGDVFVVEQECAYADLDGRDLEASARQLWIERDHVVLATLRLLDDGHGFRIGRVATAREARGYGLAAQLMRRVLELCEGRALVLEAQAYLEAWYAGLGFVRTGPDYLDDGIPHVPMRRVSGG